MENIIFFHRCNLTYHFALMSKCLSSKYSIIHIAYSQEESRILKKNGITTSVYVFVDEITELLCNETIDKALLQDIDNFFISTTGGRFNVNTNINCNRAKEFLNYDEALLLTQVYYKFWKAKLDSFSPVCILHEVTSLPFNHICSILCRSRNILYLDHSWGRGDKKEYSYFYVENDSYSTPEIEDKYKWYLGHTDKIDIARCENYITEFRLHFEILFTGQKSPKAPLWRLFLAMIREKIAYFLKKRKYDRILENIDYWIANDIPCTRRYFNIKGYKHSIRFYDMVDEEKYYYYSLHLEPEATTTYLSDGLYTNQIKLIENIASQIPVGTYLYVKDHPHEYGYRNVEDYLRLQSVPNIRLLKQNIPGKLVAKNALGVFTINGTAGFEALLLGIPVFCFGKSYYSFVENVFYVENIRDLREVVYAQYYSEQKSDNKYLLAYVNAYLESLHPGMVDFFSEMGKYTMNYEKNAEMIAKSLLKYLEYRN